MAYLLPTLTLHGKSQSDNDESDAPTDLEGNGDPPATRLNVATPTLFHKIQNLYSILALVISESKLYAGTQNGDLLVYFSIPSEQLSQVANGQ